MNENMNGLKKNKKAPFINMLLFFLHIFIQLYQITLCVSTLPVVNMWYITQLLPSHVQIANINVSNEKILRGVFVGEICIF